MSKKNILKKTIQFGYLTLTSRFLGIIREMLQVQFLGVSAMSDAFITAFRIPNFLRKIFAEGALSAASVPVIVKIQHKEGNENVSKLMSASFLFFEGIVALLCLFAMLFPHLVIKGIAPGFSPEQIAYAIPFLRILFPLIFFLSSSALLAGALHSVNHFFAPAFGPVILNIFYVSSLLICLHYGKDVIFLSKGILVGGFANFIFHLIFYLKHNFRFSGITKHAIDNFKIILKKFVPCLLGVSIIEVNLFLDSIIASYLPHQGITLLYYGNRFMNIPLGSFAIAFSTVLLPHFSRVILYAPKRLKFYLLETAKFVSWVILPAMLFLMYTAQELFELLLKGKATPEQIAEAKIILIIYSSGLLFFSINKILVNMFYSLKDTKTPTFAALIATIVNLLCNVIGLWLFGSKGIAGATVISGITLTTLSLYYLATKYQIYFYGKRFFDFFIKSFFQLVIGASFFLLSHRYTFLFIKQHLPCRFFFSIWGYWLFTIPLFLFTMVLMFYTKRVFRIRLHFLDK
jgi:putative peptidoglycan lipid II flippase